MQTASPPSGVRPSGIRVSGPGTPPLVIGGDCSILLGIMPALRRPGRYGLICIDGHLEFRHPGNSGAVKAAAGEDLAMVAGRGADDLTVIDGLRPYVDDPDVIAIAIGEREDAPESRGILQTAITVWDLAMVRKLGADITGARARRDAPPRR